MTISVPAPMSSSPDQQHQAGEQPRRSRSVPPGAARRRGNSFGTPDREGQQRERERQQPDAGLDRRQAEGDRERNSGTAKKSPAWTRNMNRNDHDAVSELEVAQHRGVDQTPPAQTVLPDPPVLPSTRKTAIATPPARSIQITGEYPEDRRRLRLRLDETPGTRTWRIAITTRPRPRADSTVPPTSRWTSFSGGVSLIRRARRRIPRTTTTSPAKTQRHEA